MTAQQPSPHLTQEVVDLSPMSPSDASRGRMVMLVDNTIDGDSRVQKSAMAAAAAGWDITLIGRSPTGKLNTYILGGATVMRVPVPYTLHARRRRAPGRSLRWPLAYRDLDTAAWRTAQVGALRNDVRVDRAHVALGSGASHIGPVALMVMRGRLFVGVRWHRLRLHELRRAIRFYTKPDNRPTTRLKVRLWDALTGERSWRHLEPVLRDYELTFGPYVEQLKPDIIHSHDFRMVGLAVRTAARLGARGHNTKVIHDVHEFLPGVRAQSAKWKVANEAHEREYIGRADAVLTVSDTLAEMLVKRHHLRVKPTVVLNAPARERLEPESQADSEPVPTPDLRADCGLPAVAPLLVYGGAAAAQRGLLTAVRALTFLPGVHLALVVMPNVFMGELQELARELGVWDRVHVVPYVAQDLVAVYYASADVGLIPIRHYPNHEIALITKYFEYIHAGLPIVTSDVEAMARTTRELGNGEVFVADDDRDLARAVSQVLSDPARYRAPYTDELLDRWSWESQAKILAAVWDRVATAQASQAQGSPTR